MKTDTAQKIIDYITEHRQATPHELGQWLGISQVAVHKQLKKLRERKQIRKWGRPPKVFYVPAEIAEQKKAWGIKDDLAQFLNKNYLYITPIGERKYGVEGFYEWAIKTIKAGQNDTPKELANEYRKFRTKANEMKNEFGLIDGLPKLKSTFTKVFVDEMYYIDFYALPRFGKSKLGKLIMYAKQSPGAIGQYISLEVADLVKPLINELIERKKFTHVSFVPPTVPRKTQFMKDLEKGLQLTLPKIEIEKIFPPGSIRVPQKSLSTLEERRENAAQTFFLSSKLGWQRLLLIDDAVGSGSTMNEVSRKLKEQCGDEDDVKIIGLGLTGSFKGFEVIREA